MANNEARVVIRVDDKSTEGFNSFKRGMQEITSAFSLLSGTLAAVGVGIGAGAFTAFIKSGIDAVAALDDLSEKTSLSVETLSGLAEVARIGGHDLDSLASVASKFAVNASKAASGNKDMADAFKAMNISLRDANGNLRATDELFIEFASKVANAEDAAVGLGNAVKLGGRAAASALPAFKDLAEQGRLNVLVTTQQAAEAEKLQKSMARLTETFEHFKISIATLSVPWIQKLLDDLNEMALLMDRLGGWKGFAAAGANPAQKIDELSASLVKLYSDRDRLSKTDQANQFAVLDNAKKIAEAEKEIATWRDVAAKRTGTTAKLGEQDFGPPVLPSKFRGNANVEEDKQALRDREKLIKELADQEKRGAESYYARVSELENQRYEEGQRLNKERLAQIKEVADLEEKASKSQADRAEAIARIQEEQGQAANKARLTQIEKDAEAANDAIKELGLTFTSAFEDAIAGGKSFSDILKGLESDIIKVITRLLVTKPLLEAIGRGFEAGKSGGGLAEIFGAAFPSIFGSAKGNAFGPSGMIPFAQGGIVAQPTIFPFARGIGLMGEAGAEAIMPLKRTASGDLGVASSGGGVTVNISMSGSADRRSAQQVAAEVGRAVARASRRNN